MNSTTSLPTIDRLAAGAFLTLLMLLARCSDCRGQVHFRFNTSTVIMVDAFGQMDVGSASWPVIASGDSLIVGMPGRPLVWYGIRWTETGDGALHCLTAHFYAKYLPGPAGKSLYIRPGGAIKEMEFHERQITKL